ncbi:MAG: hypothetical protein HOK30_23080 [Rhodospirillaceae bacterium]|nr:hypothetical protein [Rhodospirillaceae bacterium]
MMWPILTAPAHGLVLVSDTTVSYFRPGGSLNTTLFGYLGAATGNDVQVVSNLSDAAQVGAADALWVTARNYFETMSATEISNIQTFAATGKRVVLFGEHGGWGTWNTSILAVPGGTNLGGGQSGVITASSVSHPLTVGVGSVELLGGSAAAGGTSLFAYDFINLWGAGQNVLTIQDSNLFQNANLASADNNPLALNLVDWIAGSAAFSANAFVISAPPAAFLFVLGLAGIAVWRRRLNISGT